MGVGWGGYLLVCVNVDLLFHVCAKLDSHIFILLARLCNELRAAKASQLRGSYTGGKCLT